MSHITNPLVYGGQGGLAGTVGSFVTDLRQAPGLGAGVTGYANNWINSPANALAGLWDMHKREAFRTDDSRLSMNPTVQYPALARAMVSSPTPEGRSGFGSLAHLPEALKDNEFFNAMGAFASPNNPWAQQNLARIWAQNQTERQQPGGQ